MDGKVYLVLGIMVILACLTHCRDFYMGMFQKDDRLVVQDRLYKERVPYRKMTAKYLKAVRCPISYLRVVDRLGVGNGPYVRIVRGGLRKNHVYLYIMSAYNQPLSVSIYIGCPKFKTTTTVKTTKATAAETRAGDESATTAGGAGGNSTDASTGNGTTTNTNSTSGNATNAG